jgi:hypothetical protein
MDLIKIKDGRAETESLSNSKDAIYKLDKGFRVDAGRTAPEGDLGYWSDNNTIGF